MTLYCELAHKECHRKHDTRNNANWRALRDHELEAMYGEAMYGEIDYSLHRNHNHPMHYKIKHFPECAHRSLKMATRTIRHNKIL